MLSDKELESLIRGGESSRVEFTESRDGDKIRKAICAFANDLPNEGKPGVIFVGITDKGERANLPITAELLEKLAPLGELQPPPSRQVAKVKLLGGDVAVIQVEPSDNTPVRYKGVCWVRVGPTQSIASEEDERILTEKRAAKPLHFDMQGGGRAPRWKTT